MPLLFLDLDGVLADFDTAYETQFGPHDRNAKDAGPFWRNVQSNPTFFADLPPLPDAMALWDGASLLSYKAYGKPPIILTGMPHSMPQVPDQKRDWVRRHLGEHVEAITCFSRNKCLYGRPGDVLVDDWPKYQDKWEAMGGIFVRHTSAAESLVVLKTLFA